MLTLYRFNIKALEKYHIETFENIAGIFRGAVAAIRQELEN